MWSFFKKRSSPEDKRAENRKLPIVLTDDEKQAVIKQFAYGKRPGKEMFVKSEVAEEFENGVTAQGLFHYAKMKVMESDFDSYRDKRNELIDKAIVSIKKAYEFCPLPIYMYDLACFMEMRGRSSEAKGVFRTFLELQIKFKPTQIQEILLNSENRDIDNAIIHAKEKAKP